MIIPFEAYLATSAAASVLSTVDWTDEVAVSHLPPGAARAALDRLIADGLLVHRPHRELFAAEISADGRVVTGLLAVVSPDHEVRPHERVLADRVASLARHLGVIGAETVPVTLAHRSNQALVDGVADVISGPPLVEAEIEGASEKLWAVDPGLGDLLSGALYIVDGHHRVVAASERGAGFLALIVPADQLRLSSFHRVVFGEEHPGRLLEALGRMGLRRSEPVEPRPGEVTVVIDGSWYTLPLPLSGDGGSRVMRLDSPRLHHFVLGPLFGVGEDCVTGRVEPVPATAGLRALAEPGVLAGFALAPPSIEDVLSVADGGETLPAKTTYATPKPLAGLVVRLIGAG